MRGLSGHLFSGHQLIDNRIKTDAATEPLGSGRPATTRVSNAKVHFANLSDAEINAYVATGEPLKVAGAFTIDGLGGAFIRAIEGDPHTVIGLSLPTLREMAIELGVDYYSMWNR
jgi:septum formation protein